MKAPRRVTTLVAGLLAGWIVVLGAKRAALLVRSSGAPRDAIGEERFSGYADRDPPLLPRLEQAASRLRSGEAVVPVCSPECETWWFSVMASYALPRQAVLPAKTEGQLGTIYPTRLVRTRAEVRVEPRSGPSGRR